MKAPRTRLAKFVAERTLKQGVSRSFSEEVAAYLLSEGRTGELDSLLRDIQADWAGKGHVEVVATSARPLSSAVKADITKKVKALYPQAEKIVINEVHDPEIIGGVRLALPNQQLDLGIRTKLNKFKQLAQAAGKE
ncbi:MAG TPA: F0F1 ATP synthase subunit delta [Candidatus Saccharimonadales bacterium]|nr:F0F1 ATP synthase subunit delta [Candidatus Saccharimonadales bacterium]